jgi:hypothetical protein
MAGDAGKLGERKKLSHVGTVRWRIKTLKRKTDAPDHVGSGDWLGRRVSLSLYNLNTLGLLPADEISGWRAFAFDSQSLANAKNALR